MVKKVKKTKTPQSTPRTLTDASIRATDEEAALMLAYHLTLAGLLMAQFDRPIEEVIAARVGTFLDGDRDCAEAEAARLFVRHLDEYYGRMR